MELVFDNYHSGGTVKEIKVNNRREYGEVVTKYLSENIDNFITARGKNRSFVIESGTDGLYTIYELYIDTKISMPLMEAIDYVYNEIKLKLI